jgi:type 1 glutamine amidotransferase
MHAVRYRQIMQSSQQTAETRETPEVTTRRALVVSGAGRYADPWHPFAATSVRISHILRDVGFAVEVSESVDDSLAALQSDASDVDLLVVNVGSPREPDAADAGSRAGLLAHLGRGGAVLSMHVSATSFPAIPEWEAIVGGIWVRGTTMHPDAGPARIKMYAERHAIVAPLHDFTVFDERYSYLRTADEVVPLATHEHNGIEHPLVWVWEYGPARVVYDALGHDARSYESPEHCELVGRAALWLVGDL